MKDKIQKVILEKDMFVILEIKNKILSSKDCL